MRRLALCGVLAVLRRRGARRVRAPHGRRSRLPGLARLLRPRSPRAAPRTSAGARAPTPPARSMSRQGLARDDPPLRGRHARLLIVLPSRRSPPRPRRQRARQSALALALLAIVVVQALLGMLTVTWQLTPAHRDAASAAWPDDARAAVVARCRSRGAPPGTRVPAAVRAALRGGAASPAPARTPGVRSACGARRADRARRLDQQ